MNTQTRLMGLRPISRCWRAFANGSCGREHQNLLENRIKKYGRSVPVTTYTIAHGVGREDPAEHRQPWLINVHEHTLTPVIDLKPSRTGWADSRTGIVTDFGLSAEWADHLIPLASVSIIGRTLWSPSPITQIVKEYQPLDTTRDWCDQ